MKSNFKLFLFSLFLFSLFSFGLFFMSTNSVFAQVDSVYIVNQDEIKHDPTFRASEIKINAIYALIGMPEISYEKILSDETGAGISLAIGTGTTDGFGYNFMLMPYYRVYFGRRENASGFFGEINGAIFNYKENYTNYNPYYSNTDKNMMGYGIGFAIGKKYLSRSGKWTGDICYGLGRNLAVSLESNTPLYFRGGVSIGRRF